MFVHGLFLKEALIQMINWTESRIVIKWLYNDRRSNVWTSVLLSPRVWQRKPDIESSQYPWTFCILWRQAGLLQQTKATKKHVFLRSVDRLRDFESPKVFKCLSTADTLHVGKSFDLGGRNLLTPLKNRETNGSCPTGNPVLGSGPKVDEIALL